MASEQTTVADLFRRAQAIRSESPQTAYRDVAKQLVREYAGAPFPPTYNLTIPEQDARAPEEDWSAGLPLVNELAYRFHVPPEIVVFVMTPVPSTIRAAAEPPDTLAERVSV